MGRYGAVNLDQGRILLIPGRGRPHVVNLQAIATVRVFDRESASISSRRRYPSRCSISLPITARSRWTSPPESVGSRGRRACCQAQVYVFTGPRWGTEEPLAVRRLPLPFCRRKKAHGRLYGAGEAALAGPMTFKKDSMNPVKELPVRQTPVPLSVAAGPDG